ncbi:protein PXR1-like [Miscanthus floridulus]|uniref:protein PXR1-like n=1 Tax=Miscanthus floridulus TaxID=154761 RepID=UPI0034577250
MVKKLWRKTRRRRVWHSRLALHPPKNKSKGKAKKKESSDEECSHDDSDDEALALFVRKFGKMKKKKGYGARKRRDHFKNKEYVRLCYKWKSPNLVVANYPYNSNNEDNEKKKNKKEKKEKKEKKMTFKKKKKGGSYVVTWDSDASIDDDSSDYDKASKKKALASIAINNKPSLFDTPSCFMAKGSKVKNDKSENDDSESENDSDDDEFSNEQLMNILEQADSIINKKKQEVQRIGKEV